MRIAVMGAGGIGSYLGALLAKSGADVTLICRGAHLAAVREHGLRVRSASGEFTVSQIAASDDPTLAGSAEIIIQAVKLYDLGASTRALSPSLGPRSLVVTVQNGVTAADEAGAIVGGDRVVPGLVFITAHLEAPGVVVSRGRSQTFIIGAHDARIAAFQERCAAAGIDARISADIRADLWRKFIPVAALSALACLCRQPIGPILADPALARLHRQAMEEVAALARTKEVTWKPTLRNACWLSPAPTSTMPGFRCSMTWKRASASSWNGSRATSAGKRRATACLSHSMTSRTLA